MCPGTTSSYWFLTAANVGAVIMPWMVFYQQSAVADKKLQPEHFTAARWDTAVGALITQLVMAAVVIATAATIGRTSPTATLNSVGDISHAITPFLGEHGIGKLVFSAGILGAGLVASIVVSLASAWGFRRGNGLPAQPGGTPVQGALVLRRGTPPAWWHGRGRGGVCGRTWWR